MPSNDERRQVAARLRDIAACKDYKDYLGTNDFALAIKRVFRATVPIPRTDKAYLLSIADLIEPEPEKTCEIEFDFPQEVGFKQIGCRCSECWHGMSVHDNYCAECGAKDVD